MNARSPEMDHEEVWNLLPWLVNGRLSDADRSRVAAHLLLCGACREEHAMQRDLYEVLAAESPIESLPIAGLNKLHQRIEREASAERAATVASPAPDVPAAPAGPAAPAAPGNAPPEAQWPAGSVRGPWHLKVTLAASVTAVAVAVAFAVAGHWNRGPRSDYYTVTSPAPPQRGAVIRAVFSPAVTVAQLQVVLDTAHLRIVSGPSEAGVYSLAMNGSESTAWSLQKLRAQDGVRFAEAIEPAVDPPASILTLTPPPPP
jgi:anti-sigma factor RsiW